MGAVNLAGIIWLLMIAGAIFYFGKITSTGIAKKIGGGIVGLFAALKAADVIRNSNKNNNSQNVPGTNQSNSMQQVTPNRENWQGPFDSNGRPVNK